MIRSNQQVNNLSYEQVIAVLEQIMSQVNPVIAVSLEIAIGAVRRDIGKRVTYSTVPELRISCGVCGKQLPITREFDYCPKCGCGLRY